MGDSGVRREGEERLLGGFGRGWPNIGFGGDERFQRGGEAGSSCQGERFAVAAHKSRTHNEKYFITKLLALLILKPTYRP